MQILEFLEASKRPEQPVADLSPKIVSGRRKILLSLEDIKDAPKELLEELNLSDTDKQEMLIEAILNDAGGTLSLDKILVELYKRTGQVHKRNVVISRLYRMGNRGLIYSLPGKKGVYSTYEISPQDVKRLFGQLDEDEAGESAKE
jgi:hypothetical protein